MSLDGATPQMVSAHDLALLYSPPRERLILESLFGIEREIAKSLRAHLDHQVAHSRLEWWREECERTARGRPTHPLTQTLSQTVGAATALEGLGGFVDIVTWDLAGATFETRKELTAYCERWAAAMLQPLLLDRDPIWRPLGRAMRECQMLTDFIGDAHRGRLRMPLNELERIGADPAVMEHPPLPNAVADLLRARYAAVRAEMAYALSQLPSGQHVQMRGLLVWCTLISRISRRAQRALPYPLRPRRFDFIKDAWSAWSAARRAMGLRFKLE